MDNKNKSTDWGVMFGELIAEVRSLKNAFNKNTESTEKRIVEMNRVNEKAFDELKEKNEKQDAKIDEISDKVTRNTTMCTIAGACITAGLIAAIKLEFLT